MDQKAEKRSADCSLVPVQITDSHLPQLGSLASGVARSNAARGQHVARSVADASCVLPLSEI